MFAVLVIYMFPARLQYLHGCSPIAHFFPDRATQEQLDVLEKTLRQSITKCHVQYEDMMINHQILARKTHHSGKSRSFSHGFSPRVFPMGFPHLSVSLRKGRW